jgi:UDP-glucose 4-epimerase
VALPAAAFGALAAVLPAARRADLSSDETAFLSYGRGLDTTAMREVLGFEPSYTTAEAFDAFAARLPPGVFGAERLAEIEQQVKGWAAAVGADVRR